MEENKNFFERKSVVAAFGIVALLGGFFFLNVGFFNFGLTGNVIGNSFLPINLISLIGLLLIACSAVLIIYAIVKRR